MFRLSQVLLNPKKAKRHPFEIIFVGFFYVSLSILISLWIFPEYASLFSIFLTVVSCLYIVQGILITEEKKEKNTNTEKSLLKMHSRTIIFFSWLFLGFLLAFTFWTIVLPDHHIDNAFSVQQIAFQDISSITGRSIFPGAFQAILFNNLRVMLLSLLLALFYGAGAVFILVWNASVMGFVIGTLAKNVFGLAFLPQIFIKYLIHGIPEMIAYFAAALAGGILFISLVKGDFKSGRTKRMLIDASITILISVAILVLAALIEVYISPFI